MLPVRETTRYIRAYSGVRPLVGSQEGGDARTVSRDFSLLDHEPQGVENFTTITGGKLTTYRIMAERTADLVCRRLGISNPCRTRIEPLPTSVTCMWTETGMAPQEWIKQADPEDAILCECELVPQSAIDTIIASIRERKDTPDIEAIGLRSRVGKGPCQGTFCSVKIAGHMLDRAETFGAEGLNHVKEFLCRRWRGQHPILWGNQLIQAELMESLHCGLFSQELKKE